MGGLQREPEQGTNVIILSVLKHFICLDQPYLCYITFRTKAESISVATKLFLAKAHYL